MFMLYLCNKQIWLLMTLNHVISCPLDGVFHVVNLSGSFISILENSPSPSKHSHGKGKRKTKLDMITSYEGYTVLKETKILRINIII